MTDKVMSDSSAYMRGLAEMRGRPVDWAERFVTEAASVSDSEALKHGIIEYQSASTRTLLTAIDGHQVTVKGTPWIVSTATSEIDKATPTWRDDFLAAITDPNIAYILLLLGIYGLMFEFSNPGLILPERRMYRTERNIKFFYNAIRIIKAAVSADIHFCPG